MLSETLEAEKKVLQMSAKPSNAWRIRIYAVFVVCVFFFDLILNQGFRHPFLNLNEIYNYLARHSEFIEKKSGLTHQQLSGKITVQKKKEE